MLRLKRFVRLLLVALATSCICELARASSTGGLRAQAVGGQSQQTVPDMVPSHWGGNSFRDSPIAFNPWSGGVKYPLLDDLQPVAPYDRLDKTPKGRLTSVGPILPGTDQTSAVLAGATPDFVPTYQHPKNFPWEGADDAPHPAQPGMVPIGDRYVVAKPDRLRQVSRWDPRPSVNYPLVAPSNRLQGGPNPVAAEDYVNPRYGKYIEQVYNNAVLNKQAVVYEHIFHTADVNKDNSISPEEYASEVRNRQKKSQTEAQLLWGRFHTTLSEDMSHDEFARLAATGFDVGYVNRSDINMVLVPPSAANRGFWGSGVACPTGKFAKGARVKVMAISNNTDNTALNSIELKCSDDSTVRSAEGPDGSWSDWATCPDGQIINGFRARIQDYGEARDNSGINDIEFGCRSADLSKYSTLRFETTGAGTSVDAQTGRTFVTATSPVAIAGGWMPMVDCGNSGLVCAVQVRLEIAPAPDTMGITDSRVFCCAAAVDCGSVCHTSSSTTPACTACKAKSGASGGLQVLRR